VEWPGASSCVDRGFVAFRPRSTTVDRLLVDRKVIFAHTARVTLDLTPEEQEALAHLLGPDDLLTALVRSFETRVANSRNGGLIIAALQRNGMSRREIARRLSDLLGRHVAESTIRGWGTPPAEDDDR
jgi:hypothetical protein